MNHAVKTRSFFSMRTLVIALCLGLIAIGSAIGWAADPKVDGASTWYKGNLHAHSLWSDGDDFPEMVADWYKSHGYQFLGLSDHNVLMRGQRWIDVQDKKRPVPERVMANCRRRFGDSWVETRGEGANRQVRLKTLAEVREKLETPGKFLLIENEEITGKCGDHEVHLNAVNLAELILPRQAKTVADTLRLDVAAAEQQAARTGRSILVFANHPNWRWYDVAPEDLAQAADLRFFEVCNASPETNNLGDRVRPSTERIWDVANTIRIAQMRQPPLCALASDDAHEYQVFGPDKGNPGRGWIMVRARELSAAAIVEAISRGDFYASTGVTLRDVAYDAKQGTLTVAVEPQGNAQYTIEFIGTLAGADPSGEPVQILDPPKMPPRTVKKYSPEIGKVLSAVQGTSATYKLRGNELCVRAVVRSNKPLANPLASEPRKQEAWCQPVGWQPRLQRPE